MRTGSGAVTRIRIIYPKPEQEIYEDSTFLMGELTDFPPGARLWINGEEVPLSSQGFFSWKIPIHAGMNPVKAEARMSEAILPLAQELFALYGVPPLVALPALPLAVHEETLQPASDVWLGLDDQLTVCCSASVDAQVSFSIPGCTETPMALHSVSADSEFIDTREAIFAQLHWTKRRMPIRGYYTATVAVKTLLEFCNPQTLSKSSLSALSILLHLRYGNEVLEVPLPGQLTFLSQPRPAVVRTDRATTRTAPINGARLTPQRSGTLLAVSGMKEGWAKARLSSMESVYLSIDDLTLDDVSSTTLAVSQAGESVSNRANDPAGKQGKRMWSVSPPVLRSIQTQAHKTHATQVSLIFTGNMTQAACPIQIEALSSSNLQRLCVRLYGVCSACDFVHYPSHDALIRQIHWRQVAEDVLELWIDLVQPLSGYDYEWRDGQWQFFLKVLPRRISETHVLIDPGHGASETGATGLNGLPEKDLNLAVSLLLRDALLQEGFKVSMTRHRDEEVSLSSRGEMTVSENADLVLSVHHNALPDGRDPLQAKGACCFYYHSFSKSLAEALLKSLTHNEGSRFEVPNYGLFYDSLYMTRIHQATAVLVELGFFTCPEEFERLIHPAFQQEAARRLAVALRDYVNYRNQLFSSGEPFNGY